MLKSTSGYMWSKIIIKIKQTKNYKDLWNIRSENGNGFFFNFWNTEFISVTGNGW